MRADRQLHPEHSLCVQEGRISPAAATDHIVSMRNGGSQFDESNLQSLCVRCNSRKRNLVDVRGRQR
jgi:5-methylcytosine-specific restriction endonuclease McrA